MINKASSFAQRRVSMAVAMAIACLPYTAAADEGGVGFWLPGQMGSLAAAPATPGLSLATLYYHAHLSAGADVSTSREIEIGKFSRTATLSLSARLNATADMGMFVPSYAFATPVLGGQAAVSVTGVYGRTATSLAGTVSLTVPPFSVTRSDSINDTAVGFGDLFPQFSLRWNAGVHNFMTYAMAGVPIGKYNSASLANVGIGHGAVDGGAGYTYFNPQTGREFSITAGLTSNFENPDTHYKNGNDLHIDFAASQFLGPQMHVGFVGYLYRQVSGDSGSGAQLGHFKSEVNGLGPQVGFLFPVGDLQGYMNIKAYKEFDAVNRPEGWNSWLTFSVSPPAPKALPPDTGPMK